MKMNEVLEAVREASISIACCLDEVDDVTQQDLEHIQDQITMIENYLKWKQEVYPTLEKNYYR
jgi:AMMECR1 domain-containing protein